MLVVYGTRPEAIKMAPVVRALQAHPALDPVVCTTAQHRQLVDQVHELFGLSPDIDLDLMTEGQQLSELSARVLTAVHRVIEDVRPDRLLVQGDTTTAMATALAGFHAGVPVGHVEAGLRTGDLGRPFPEEANRRVIDVLADTLFAPTPRARDRLVAEGAQPDRVFLTGNTAIDALHAAAASLGPVGREDEVLVTIHRRESFGAPMEEMFAAVADLAARHPELRWVVPVHPNPNVGSVARRALGGVANADLLEPLGYPDVVRHLQRARLVLTDSGGIQEEAPTFGTPVLVLRDTTERPEGIEAGVARLVGVDRSAIVAGASALLEDDAARQAMARASNPYGDGRAAARIAAVLTGDPWSPWEPRGAPDASGALDVPLLGSAPDGARGARELT